MIEVFPTLRKLVRFTMTKSSRAKKAKKADFAKVKLKVGKKLKKAQNETRSDFKTRKIIIKEQLAKKSDQTLLTKKKHNIKELISRLNHNSPFVRQDGVNGLLELVKNNEMVILQPYLSTLIPGVAPCIFDTDALIRTSAIKFMEALIVKVGFTIEPYFNIVATHLSCAMVHLNIGVQGDSLKLMKVLIKHTPALIARHANTLLNNFINLISRKASNSEVTRKKPGVVDFTRILHVNPDSSLSGHKWQLQLLQELSSFLEAILMEQGRIQSQVPHTTWQTIIAGSVPPLVCGNSVLSNTQEVWLFSDPQQLKKFTLSIMPLLFQIWAEVEPKDNTDSPDGNSLSEDGVETLSCIVNIIMHLWHIIQICMQQHPAQCSWFLGQLKSKYMSKIMSGFPYYRHMAAVQKKKKKRKSADKDLQCDVDFNIKHCDDLNVTLALFCMQMSSSKWFQEHAVNFLSKLLRDRNRDNQYDIGAVVKILMDLLQVISKSQAETLVTAAQICYCRLHPLKKDRALLLQILLAATDIDHPYLWECGSNSVWVNQIVNDLANGDVRETVLQAAIILRLRGNTKLRELVLTRKVEIREKIKCKGVQGMTSDQVNNKLLLLLKD